MLTKRQKQFRWTIGKLAAVAFVAALVMLPKDFELPDFGGFNPLVTQAMASGGELTSAGPLIPQNTANAGL